MARALALILLFQLLGEALSRAASLPVPGPVTGLVLLVAACLIHPPLAEALRSTANGILAHLGLLFVPAGVGVVGHVGALGADGPALAAALVGSTVAAIAVGAGVFVAVARLTGRGDD